MKLSLLISLVLLLVFSSCRKDNDPHDELTGSWKVMTVVDKTTSAQFHPPAGSDMNIVITFLGAGKFAGHTLRNTIVDGSYTQSADQIVFKNFSVTRIAEDGVGQRFLAVLNACSLQSSNPCAPSK